MASELTTATEVLFRQIHPNSLQGGEPGSDRFRPSEMDKNLLSTDRSAKTSAENSHALYTSAGKLSAAVFGVTVEEFNAESIRCVDDPIKDDPQLSNNPAHAVADFSAHEKSQQKLIAKRLKKAAVKRGCLFEPASITPPSGSDVSSV